MPFYPPAPELPKEQNTTQRAMWQDTGGLEEHYSLKPEPYSLESGQKDPELLGPQSTLKRSLAANEMRENAPSPAAATGEGTFVPREEPPKPADPGAMTRSKCIDLIGKAKYDEYTRRYGSEAAALRKCTILQRVQH
jgi:hypothetical protein